MHPESQKRSTTDYSARRPMGLAPWQPQSRSQGLVRAIDAVLDEYEDNWPLTARQVYYRLIGTGHVSKSANTAKQIADFLTRGRRSGRWGWDTIRDDGSTSSMTGGGDRDPESFLDYHRGAWRYYGRSLHQGQPQRVVVWCEAAGMAPQLEDAVRGLPVSVVSGGGQPSVTLIHSEAEAIVDDGRPCVLVYVGDYDRHGVQIEDRVADDLDRFITDMGGDAHALRFCTVAVTPAQVTEFNLPDDPTSPGSYQAEAIPPDVLSRIVRDACRAEVDLDQIAEVEALSEVEKVELRVRLESL
jgi:hypothetical protein